MGTTKKIFVFMNSGRGTDWIEGMALCEDGRYIAGHVSSSEGFFKHDMGLTSDWHHDDYKSACPDGYELVYVDDPRNHEGLMAAYKLNQETVPAASPSEVSK